MEPVDASAATGAVLVARGPGSPTLTGRGPLDLLCGRCGFKVCAGVEHAHVRNLVVECGACGSLNRIAP